MNVGMLIYDDVQALDVVGPLDVFASANERSPGTYRLFTVSPDGKPVRAENGLRLTPDFSIRSAPEMDTLLIAGGAGSRVIDADRDVLDWIVSRTGETRRVVSICTGVYILAATGLLDGRKATTHWEYAADVKRRYPDIALEEDRLFVRDGKFHTSGGLTAGMDLALSLVEEDRGASAALAVARNLVMYMKRPGNQAQFSRPLQAQGGGRLAQVVEWMLDHLHEDITVERLADVSAMSERNFRRVFRETFDVPPTRFLERLRLEQACVLLTSGTDSVERIARATGFASADALRRAFRVRYGASPVEYRQRFG